MTRSCHPVFTPHPVGGGAVHLKTALSKSCCQRAIEPGRECDVWMTN